MLEDKSRISNTNKWYQKVQMCRRLPPRCSSVDGYHKLECYKLSLRNAQLPGVNIPLANIGKLENGHVISHSCLFLRQTTKYSENRFMENGNLLVFTVITDVVLEIVEEKHGKQNSDYLYTAA
ncbi:unnamed protein product [Onchocerca flexuosa]|uniref:Uncharacterized protein n=1 Tax=Onchocerca flexuosa TaxID=387005 RepID=A0A183H946_9BILA|nr:unnamed protein product [Onchocerca flexuosa]